MTDVGAHREHERRGRVVDQLLADSPDGDDWALVYLYAELTEESERHQHAAARVRQVISSRK